jgi:hypothetical protein
MPSMPTRYIIVNESHLLSYPPKVPFYVNCDVQRYRTKTRISHCRTNDERLVTAQREANYSRHVVNAGKRYEFGLTAGVNCHYPM